MKQKQQQQKYFELAIPTNKQQSWTMKEEDITQALLNKTAPDSTAPPPPPPQIDDGNLT